MIAYLVILGWPLAILVAGVSGVRKGRYLKRLGSKQAVIDILRHELKRVAGELQAEREETYRLRAEVKRLTPKRNVHGCFVGKDTEL